MEQLQNDIYGRKIKRELINNTFFKYYIVNESDGAVFEIEAPLEKNLFEVYRTIEGMAPYIPPTIEETTEF